MTDAELVARLHHLADLFEAVADSHGRESNRLTQLGRAVGLEDDLTDRHEATTQKFLRACKETVAEAMDGVPSIPDTEAA